MQIFQDTTLIHFMLFVIYLIFAYSILDRRKPDPHNVIVAYIFISISLWALGKSVMHNSFTSFETAELTLKLTAPFNLMIFTSLLVFIIINWFSLRGRRGWILLISYLIIYSTISIILSFNDIFLLEKCDFGWMAVDNPHFGQFYNTFLLSHIIISLLIPFIFRKHITPNGKKQILIIGSATVLGLMLYYVIPSKPFIMNSADIMILPGFVAYYFAIKRYGLFDFSYSDAASSVFDSLGEYVLFTDPSGLILYAGKAFIDKIDIKKDEELGYAADYFENTEKINKLIEVCLRVGIVRSGSLIMKLPGHGPIYCAVTVTRIRRLSLTTSLVWIISDVTEKHKYEQLLSEYNDKLKLDVAQRTQELEKTTKDLEYFTYASYHDLKEPLRQINTGADMLEQKYFKDKGNADAMELLEFIKTGASHMQNLLTNIRNYVGIDKVRSADKEIELNECLKESIGILNNRISEYKAKINFSDLPCVMGNHDFYVSVFMNLIDNALKYCDENPEIEVFYIDGTVCVSDNGPGIEEKYREKVFEIFERLSYKGEKGSGMGLAICKKMIEFNGGRIWVEENARGGSVFKFTVRTC